MPPETGRIDPLSRSLRSLYDKVRVAYLSARERPKDYKDEWNKVIEEIRDNWDSPNPIGDLLRDELSESLIYSEEVKDPQGAKAKRVYQNIKEVQEQTSLSKDPFRKKFGDKLPKLLLNNTQVYAMFLHWAYRAGRGALDGWEDVGDLEDDFTEGYVGLDLTDGELFRWLEKNYGEEVDVKRLKRKMQPAREMLYEVYTKENSSSSWQELTDTKRILKEDKELNDFIIPNKPMYRIFEIDDMKEIKGFSGDYVVQEKYDGMRIQIHKNKEIKIYSFNRNDITRKFDKQVELMRDDDFPECILDAEVVLYENDEPLHRADTISYINSKKDDSAFELRVHVFDIIRLNGEHVWKNKLEERLQTLMGNFNKVSHRQMQFPTKSNTRFADSLEDIEEYAMEIMKNPTSEGVIIKDAKSSYIVGKKKNPKWVKWKKFVDLDLLILEVRKNKNGTFSYTLGAGPLGDEEYKPIVRYKNKDYLNVGKALNTKIKSEEGNIIRVKVDEVKKTKTGFSIYSAKVIEKPEVTEPEKIITLEFLSKDNKKSASDYSIEALKKSYSITDNIHGIVNLNTSYNTEGFVLSGFLQDNLMAKNALIDIDLWKQELANIYKKDSGKLMSIISEIVYEGEITKQDLVKKLKEKAPDIINRIFSEGDIEKGLITYIKERGEAFGILYNKERQKFYHDDKTLVKDPEDIGKMEENTYEIWRREDGDLNFIYKIKEKTFAWRIEQDKIEDMYELFGKAERFLAEYDKEPQKNKKVDEGTIKIGSQRDGYHEYFLKGKMYSGKIHFRVVQIMKEDKWIVFTGYKEEPTDKDSDEGLWDISEDKYINITFSEE